MTARRPFTAHAARLALRLGRRSCVKTGVDRPRAWSIGLVWRRSRPKGFAQPHPTPMRAAISLETRLIVVQRQTDMHWTNVIGRPGPSGKPGADGRQAPRVPQETLRSGVRTLMIWSKPKSRIGAFRSQPADTGRPVVPGAPDSANALLASPFQGVSGRLPQGLKWRSGRQAVAASPAGIVSATLVIRPPRPTLLAFRTLLRGPAGAGPSGRRADFTWHREDRPALSAGDPQRAKTLTDQDKATPAMVLEWRKAEARSSVSTDKIADPFVGQDHQRVEGLETAAASLSATRPGSAPEARRRSGPDPDRPATMPRFEASDLAHLADEVIRRIDKRERIARERAGR